MGVRWSRGEVFGGQSHFPDCLVLKEGGRGINKDDCSPSKRFHSHSSLSFSVATVGNGDGEKKTTTKKQGAQQ